MSAASIKIMHQPQPSPSKIMALDKVNVTRVACGHNHTIAVDDEGNAYTWGEGSSFALPILRRGVGSMPWRAACSLYRSCRSFQCCNCCLLCTNVHRLFLYQCHAGNGGYGRLGHNVQQDEFKPRVLTALQGRITVPADAVVR